MFLVAHDGWRLGHADRAWLVLHGPFNGSHDFAGGHLQLRRHHEFVIALHPGRTSAYELCCAKGSQHGKFERADLGWTVDHRSQFFRSTRGNHDLDTMPVPRRRLTRRIAVQTARTESRSSPLALRRMLRDCWVAGRHTDQHGPSAAA